MKAEQTKPKFYTIQQVAACVNASTRSTSDVWIDQKHSYRTPSQRFSPISGRRTLPPFWRPNETTEPCQLLPLKVPHFQVFLKFRENSHQIIVPSSRW